MALFLKRGGWWRLGMCSLLLWAGCAVEHPAFPRLQTTLRIAVANDTTTVQEIAEERPDYLAIAADGRMTLGFATEFNTDDRQFVGDRLRVIPSSGSYSSALGLIKLPALPPINFGLEWGVVLGRDVAGVVLPTLPAQSFVFNNGVHLEDLAELDIASGQIEISLANGWSIGLERISLRLVDQRRGGQVVAEAEMGMVLPFGGTGTAILPLDDRLLSGDMVIEFEGVTLAGEEVPLDSGARLAVEIIWSELQVRAVEGQIPAQRLSQDQVLDFPDDRIQVIRADVRQGEVAVRFTNTMAVPVTLEFFLDELRKPDQTTQRFFLASLGPGAVFEQVFDLTGNSFAPRDPLQLRLSYNALTLPVDGTVRLTSEDAIDIEVVPSEFVFDRVEGKLNRLALDLEAEEASIDFPEGLDNIDFEATEAVAYLTSAVGFRSEIDLDIQGTNKAGQRGNLQLTQIFERGDPNDPVAVVVALQSDELTDFLNLLPSQLTVHPRAILGDGVGTEIIDADHWVQIDSVVFSAPARFRIKDNTTIEPDVQRQRANDPEFRRRVESNLLGAKVLTTIENHLPLGVKVRLHVARRMEDVYSKPDLVIPGPGEEAFQVRAAAVENFGRVSETVTSQQVIEIAKEDILIFLAEEGVYTGALIELEATAGEVEVFGTDFVVVKAGAEFELELNDSLFD